MTTTIHSLAYKITADSAGFTKGVAATRKELSSAKRIMRDTEAPIERYQRNVKEADRLLQKGAITQRQYNRHLDTLKSKLTSAQKPMMSFQRVLGTLQGGLTGIAGALGPVGIAIGAVGGAFTAAAAKAGRFTLDKITENLEKIDRVGKIGAKLNIDPQALRSLQFTAGQLSGIGGEQVATALQRMTRRVSEAAAGTGEAVKALEELGLEAERLNRLSPDQQFLRIAEAMSEVENPADQLRLAFKLFDTEGAGLVTTLTAGGSKIQELQQTFDKFAGSLSKLDVSRIETLNDELGKSNLALEGFFEQLTAEVSIPALAIIKELNATIERSQGGRPLARGEVARGGTAFLQGSAGILSRTAVRSVGGSFLGGGAANVAFDQLVRLIPDVNELVERNHQESIRQSIDSTSAIVNAVNRVEVATRDSAVAVELPPGSR